MHIELTDHLRCPQPHEEAFLVLLPDQMSGRSVVAGHLGCPACGWNCAWVDGVPDFGGGHPSTTAPPCDAVSAAALLGVSGPGGWVVLAGSAAALADELAELLPGVSLVVINPPVNTTPSERVNVLRSGAWPIKEHAMRGVVLGSDAGAWRDAAVRSVLPGLRAVGVGAPPVELPGVELLAEADGVWVVRRR
ncbi:MAG: hypothetical protein ABIZ70_00370 [Gemmatimonadales bacterium]